MAGKVPYNSELTPGQLAWRKENDPNRILTIAQIAHRMERDTIKAERELAKRREEEEKQKQRISASELRQPGEKVSVEQFMSMASDVSERAGVGDLVKVLHANMVMASQNLDLRPQDFITSIRMLREMEKEDNPTVTIDPYEIEPMSRDETCELFLEAITAHFHVWRKQHDEQSALWLVPFLEEIISMIFLDKPLSGLVKRVSNVIGEHYYEEDSAA